MGPSEAGLSRPRREDEAPLPAEARFESLPLSVQATIFSRLHWRDLLSVSQCSRGLNAQIAGDEREWRARCEARFTSEELAAALDAASTAAPDDQPHHVEDPSMRGASQSQSPHGGTAVRGRAEDEDDGLGRPSTWRGRFLRAVRHARDAVRRAAPMLTIEDNTAMHFRTFERAQNILRGVALADVREFILEGPPTVMNDTNDGRDASREAKTESVSPKETPPTLLVLAGMVECLARAPTRTPAEVVCVLRDAELGAREVRLQMWLLGRLEGVGFRLRDEVRVHQGSLEELAVNSPRVWDALLRGIRHEVRDMEVQVVGPPKKTFWSIWGGAMHQSEA